MKNRGTILSDITAGITTAVANIPDGMASAVLAGVNPVFGLYALIAGTPIAALLTSSVFMSVSTTSAMALATGGALTSYASDSIVQALIVLTMVVGVIQLIFGLLRLGYLTRFVSNAVMTGFLSGIAVLIILSQLSDLTGYKSQASNKIIQSIDLLLNINQIDFASLLIGVVTIVLIILLNRPPRLSKFSLMLAMLVSSAAVQLFNLDTVSLVGDIAEIPRSIPKLTIPQFSMIPGLVIPATAIAIIGLVQAAGVSRSIPNPDGEYPNPSLDFIGQGIGNVASGIFQGIPVGGSLSGTALNISAGAKTRYANVFSGIFVLVAVLVFNRSVQLIAMPCLAALLIIAGYQTLNFEEIADVWEVGIQPRAAMLVTFLATLILPVQHAVFLGVVFSILMYILRSASQLRIVEIISQENGTYLERDAPEILPDESIAILNIYGSLFFAGSYNLEERLPRVKDTHHSVVILRLRGRTNIGSTFINVIERYAQQLQNNGGKLILAGVSQKVKEQLDITETTETIGGENILLHSAVLGESIQEALQIAQSWLDQNRV